jgi:hypothetical protein
MFFVFRVFFGLCVLCRELCVCLFVSIAIAPNSIVFLGKTIIFCSPPPLPRCTYLLVSFYILQSIFVSVCSRGGGLLIVLASCWLQVAGGPFGCSAFPSWRCAGASSSCISQELWLDHAWMACCSLQQSWWGTSRLSGTWRKILSFFLSF